MRILVIKPSSFGDIVHALVVVERIRGQLGPVSLHWVARDIFAPLVEASGLVERVIPFHRSPSGFFRVLREIRRETYDLVLDLQGLARSGVMTFAAKGKMKIGRFDAREGSKLFYKTRAPRPPGEPPFHAVEILRQFQRPLGLYDLEPETLEFPDALKVKESIGTGAILLFPESRRPEKEWSGFLDLASQLGKEFPSRPICWCGTGSGELPDDVPPNMVDLRGEVSMGALPDLFRSAGLVIANDSGPVHLAAAMGVPVLGIFGPTDPSCFGPYPLSRDGNSVIRAEGGDLASLKANRVMKTVCGILND